MGIFDIFRKKKVEPFPHDTLIDEEVPNIPTTPLLTESALTPKELQKQVQIIQDLHSTLTLLKAQLPHLENTLSSLSALYSSPTQKKFSGNVIAYSPLSKKEHRLLLTLLQQLHTLGEQLDLLRLEKTVNFAASDGYKPIKELLKKK